MAKEIERKFLLANDQWRTLATGVHYRQGYLHSSKNCTVRVRIAGEKGFLTIKGATIGFGRNEYEYTIPVEEAEAMLNDLCLQPQIEKIRYTIPFAGFLWEVDEFLGVNLGLVVAEIELDHEEQSFPKPHWVGQEVTGDTRYYNAALCSHPFIKW